MPATSESEREAIILRYAGDRLPRYTSYPTAPHFSAAVGPAHYAQWLAETPAGALGSIYLHVPYCRTMCWYCGCHTRATLRAAPVERCLAALEREVQLVADALPGRLRVGHVHWGGGSPTLAPPASFRAVMVRLRDRFDVAADAEIAVEVDPRALSDAFVAAMADAGVNRASLGVQSFDPEVQAAIARPQSWEQTHDAAARLRAGGIVRLNADLLYGLPRQGVRACVETARRAIELDADRVSAFGYAHVPHMKPHQRMIREAELPGPRERLAQADAIAATLHDAGYAAVGLDHFARTDDPLAQASRAGRLRRNFQGYTTDRADVLLGLGASAIGRLTQGYVQNEAATGRWEDAMRAGRLATVRELRLTAEDRMRGEIIERLMCDLRVDPAAVAAACGLPTPAAELDEFERLGVVRRRGGTIEVDAAFRPLLRAVAAAFDARLAAGAARHAVAV